MLKRVALFSLALVLAFVAFTWWALESGGVAIVQTNDADGGLRETHVWYVDEAGEIWLEAGTPDNGWYRDVLADPRLRFTVDSDTSEWLARPVDDAERQRWLRASLRERYGVRDAWVGIFIDSRKTIPVRLERLPSAP